MRRILLVASIASSLLTGQAASGDEPGYASRYTSKPTTEAKKSARSNREALFESAADAIGQLDRDLSGNLPASASDQSKLLRLAARMADIAGQDKDAKHLFDEAEKDRPPLSVMEVLARRQAQLDALQAQIAALRRMTRTEQQVMVEVKMIEVSRSAMKALFGSSEKTPGVIDADHDLLARLDDLREKGAVKVLAEPTVITESGRPAYFNSGGELPFVQNQNVDFKRYGTQVDLVAQTLGGDKLQLDVKARFSQPDGTLSIENDKLKVPGLTVHECDTAIECQSGQTVMIAGLVQESKPPATAKPTDDDATEKSATGEAPQESQLLVLVKATIVKDSDVAHAAAASLGSGHNGPGSSLDLTPATKTK
jgi:hypothetical protein